ncbi:probable protein phosphatase 2C 43 [Vicia villosa]|uniref:probable protein phosphatase 2C 43 n=1 Tax=Vicia villosa TaxID=3911 RepID=UPI00273C59F4|nr:probable protein phosphatase 2C 43 [Vicia villosa]
MHPWLQTVIDMCRGKFKGDLKAFEEDPLGISINIERHCFGEFSMASVQANEFMEDRSQVEVASNNALFLGVYDGHGGYLASRFIAENLFKNLLRIAHENGNTITQDTLSSAVSDTEKQFINYVRTEYIAMPSLAKAGSCCLTAVIWKKTLYVANLGDSRAIIVSMVDGKPVVEQLTRDHNCNDIAIREELRAMHPNDPNIVFKRNGSYRVKGIIEVCRTIGDAYLKRPDFTFHDSFPKDTNGPPLPDKCVLSSEPEMRSRALRNNDKFLIFASDGLWDLMSNEQAALIVSKNPRNGIAKRLLSVALTESARRRGFSYQNVRAASPGRGNASRRSFHDDISVIVVFLEKPSILRKRVLNMSYSGLNPAPEKSDFEGSGLSSLILSPLSPRGLKASFRRRSKSVDSPLGGSSQGEDTDRLIDQSSRQTAQGRWASLRQKLFAPFRK